MKMSSLMRSSRQETMAWVLATWFGSGCAPKAPGTVGSLCSLPLVLIGVWGGSFALLAVTAVLFLVGWWAVRVVLKTQACQDPGFVVIDETVGQSLTFVLVASFPISWYILVCGFILFRFFDIVKFWPASFFDRSVHGAFGVMMDDVIAGLYAAAVLYGISFL